MAFCPIPAKAALQDIERAGISQRVSELAKLAPGCAGGIAREMESNRPLPSSSYALAHGRLDTSSCQRVKYASFGAIFMSANGCRYRLPPAP